MGKLLHGVAAVGIVSFSFIFVTRVVFAAEDPVIQAEASADEIFVGDSIDYHITIRNLKDPPEPDLTNIKQSFDVVASGDESRNQVSITVINGQKYDRSFLSHVYHYRLTPRSAGELVIPPATATTNGKVIKSNELSLKVTEPEKQDLVLVEIETSPEKVYPTQPFTVTVKVLIHPLPNNPNTDPLTPVRNQPPKLQINWLDTPRGLTSDETNRWLQPLVADDGVGLWLNEVRSSNLFDRGPVAFGLLKGRDTRLGLDGKPIRYFVYELARTFTPEKVNEYSFGPASMKGVFVSGTKQNDYVGKKLVAIAPARTVNVREVPSPRPATYCGGIGEYSVVASASPTKLRVGDPLTLTVEFLRGSQSGSLDLISAPDLLAVPHLSEDFDLVDKNPTGRIEGPVKKFSYSLRPRKSNVGLPELNISTFDPKSESFVNLQTKPIPLQVTEAAHVAAADLVGSMTSPGSSSIKSRSQGIFQNITDPSELKDERIDPVMWLAAAAAVWCLTGAAIGIVSVYRQKTSDAGWMRRQKAKKTAVRRLAEASSLLSQGKTIDALAMVRLAIISLVADVQNRIGEGLTTLDVSSALRTAAVPEEVATTMLRLLESIESAEYGGMQSLDPAAAIESAKTLISRVYPYLERRSR